MKQVLLLDDNIAQLTVRELVLRKGEIESHVATKGKAPWRCCAVTLAGQKSGWSSQTTSCRTWMASNSSANCALSIRKSR